MLFVADLLRHVLSSTCYDEFCRRFVATRSYVADDYFFVVFVLAIQIAKFDPIKLSNQIMFIIMLQIWNPRYFRHC